MVERYGELKFRMHETIFAVYDKMEMRKAKILVVASSDIVHTSKSFWPEVIVLAVIDRDLMQSVSMAIGVQRQTEMNPITIVFAGINDHLHSRGFLSSLREPASAEDSVWPAIKYSRINGRDNRRSLETPNLKKGVLKKGVFTEITTKAVIALSPGFAHLSDGNGTLKCFRSSGI